MSPLRCFKCQSWGHHKDSCRSPAPRCGVCSSPHWTESCLARLRRGERPPACCPSCSKAHHAWNPRCPARPRPATGTAASSPEEGMQAILVEFGALLAEHLGVPLPRNQLQALAKRACQGKKPPPPAAPAAPAAVPAPSRPAPAPAPKKRLSLPAPLFKPRPLLLQKGQEAPCEVPSVSSPRSTSSLSPLSGGSPPDKRRRLNTSGTQTEEQDTSSASSQTMDITTVSTDAATCTSAPPLQDSSIQTDSPSPEEWLWFRQQWYRQKEVTEILTILDKNCEYEPNFELSVCVSRHEKDLQGIATALNW